MKTHANTPTLCSLHLFAGIGGDALGFAAAGFVPTLLDSDADACAGARYLLGDAGRVIQADLSALEPADLAKLVPECPDVVIMSPPCQGNSGCLPAKVAATPKYLALNSLGGRALFLLLTCAEECWGRLPAFVLVENVPRITTRSAELVAEMKAVLHASGFLTSEGYHDCGEIGGLAQRRKRWLLAGRNPARVPARLQLPPTRPHLTIWDVLRQLPAPVFGSGEGGPMHEVPATSDLNKLRLAAIPAGCDWRKLPAQIRLMGDTVDARMDTGWGSVTDPRTSKIHRAGPYGVEDARAPSGAVIASADVTCGSFAWTDPRLPERAGRLNGGYGVEDHTEPSHAVVSTNKPDVTWASLAEPRVKPARPSKHNGHLGVQDAHEPARTVIGALRSGNGWGSVGDVRVTCDPREGSYGVADAQRPLPTSVIGQPITQNGPWSWPDPRVADAPGHFTPTHRLTLGVDGVPELWPIGDARPLDLASTAPRNDLVILAPDGTVHRPMSDFELALLQGFPLRVRGEWLCLPGSREVRRRGIGNAIPPLTARAIAEACLEAMNDHNPLSTLLTHTYRKVWVQPLAPNQLGAQPEEAQQ